MKTKILILFYLSIFLSSFSQNTFELLLDKENAQRNTSVVIDSNGDYIVSTQEFKNGQYNSILTKISATGEIIDSVYFENEAQEVILDLIQVDSNEFLVIGAIYNDIIGQSSLWLMKIDNSLNIIWDKNIKIQTKILRANSKINSKGEILIYGGVQNDINSYSAFIYRIDTNGNLLDSYYYNNQTWYSIIFDILEKNNNTGYYTFELSNRIHTLDTNFNIISEHIYFPAGLFPGGTNSFWLSDTTYILSGRQFYHDNFDLALVIVDTFHNPVDSFAIESNKTDFLAYWDNLSFIDKKNIYLVGTNNASKDPYETEPSWIMVNNFDDTLGLKWQKLIGGDAYYNATNVIATKDGGCFIAATRSDNSHYNDYDMYFLKLDSLGNVTHINGELKEQSFDYIVFPNPASDYLKVFKAVQVKQAEFILYNTAGKVVLQNTLFDNITEMNVSNLPQGVYVYNIFENGVLADEGKVVVE